LLQRVELREKMRRFTKRKKARDVRQRELHHLAVFVDDLRH
jgi:hypothetical protein